VTQAIYIKTGKMPSSSSSSSLTASSGNEMEQRMKDYQTFLSSVLRPDLERAQRDEQETTTEIRDYKELQDKLKELRTKAATITTGTGDTSSNNTTTSMLVDLGHEKVFCNAEIDRSWTTMNATREDNKSDNDDNAAGPASTAAITSIMPFVYVHVGMGFHVQFTINEALAFVDRRLDFLENQVLNKRQARLEEVKKHVGTSEMILSEIVAKLS
jgi:Prefoldin subunit